MLSVSTFYLSRIIGNRVFSNNGEIIGKLADLVVDTTLIRPKVVAARVKSRGKTAVIDFSAFSISKDKGQYILKCGNVKNIELPQDNTLYLANHIMDRQIVDMDGRKLVRVNDLRLAILSTGVYVVAVDVGVEGLLRRLGVAKPVKKLLKPFGLNLPGQLILWDEVETIDSFHAGIKLSKASTKLSKLHPSDLADIIEDLDNKTQAAIFASLDEEKAADVLEELETDVQLSVLESLSVEKAADVLEKMPADEVADILDEMEEEKAEELLSEMENEASEEVRELMEYPENSVGSLMTTDIISFNESMTVDDTLSELRRLKPEPQSVYYLYIVDDSERLLATVSLRDLVISEPDTRLNSIMNSSVIYVYDYDRINSLADIISKYNLLAIPVVDNDMSLLGTVVIDDVVYNLLKSRRRIL